MLTNKQVKYYLITIIIVIFSITKVYCEFNASSDTSSISRLIKSAQIALDSNRIFNAFQLSRKALEQSKKANFVFGSAKSLLLIGQVQSINGLKDSAISTYKESLSLFRKAKNERMIAEAMNKIGNLYSETGKQDSAEFYLNETLIIRKKLNDKNGIIGTYNNLGNVFYHRGVYSKALEYYFLSLTLQEEIGNKQAQSSSLNNIGSVFWNQGDYSKALEYFFKSLKIKEELKDIKSIALIYNNIGTVYRQMGDNNLALKYFNISLDNSRSISDSSSMSYALMGIGDLYHGMSDYNKALEFLMRSEKIRKKYSNYSGLANIYISMGDVYKDLGDDKTALKIFEQAYELYIKLNESWGKAKSLIQIGDINSELGLMQKAIDNCNQGIELSKQIGALDLTKEGYQVLYKVYEKYGNSIQAYNTYKLYITCRDSINNIEKAKQIYRLQNQADFERILTKEKSEQKDKLALAQGKSKKQTTIANIFIFAFVITLSIFILFFINSRQKQRHNDLLAFQKLDVERQKSELIFQRDELEIQKDLVIHQRDKIMTMLTDLGESIDYARKIQQAMLPSNKSLKVILGDYFLLFQPRESVGGDFYWVAQYENSTFFAIADCTGHGVPGGFMSMLGVSLLNELVSRSECSSPAKMLKDLREMIIKALNQTGLDEDSQDGMDIALCMYNPQNHHLVYSGANQSLILVTTTPPQANEKILVQNNLVELKPDRMPVAYYQRMVDFYEHEIDLKPGDSIYLFSDGYSDQFGGSLNKKFGYTSFRNLVASVSSLPFEKQKDAFWFEFDKWKGVENQTDDVIVLGIRIS
jgi:serine phosphatase RsbU (regulator of sigma subunit)/Tfp pilus assembly protein PilF